jgi:hypothetical protein
MPAASLAPFLSPVERGVSSRFAEREFAMPVAWRKASERRDAALAAGTRPQVVCVSKPEWGSMFSKKRAYSESRRYNDEAL